MSVAQPDGGGAGFSVRLARPGEHQAVAGLLLEAFTSSFWITAFYRDNLVDVARHLGTEDLWVAVADGAPGAQADDLSEGPPGGLPDDELPGAVPAGAQREPGRAPSARAGAAPDAAHGAPHPASGELLGAVFVPRATTPGPDGAPELGFGRLGTVPAARGRGVARALVAHAESVARDLGATRMAIHSGPQMHAAHRLYERLGYERHRERETLVVDSGQRLLVYTRELGSSHPPRPRGKAAPGDAFPARHRTAAPIPIPSQHHEQESTVSTRTTDQDPTSQDQTAQDPAGDDPLHPERAVEQTPDGAFRRRTNFFTPVFGDGEGEAPVEAGRYRLVISPGCGWSRRQIITLRLLGLTDVVSVGWVGRRGTDGWEFSTQPGGVDEVLGVPRLNDLYRATYPGYEGRGTVPTVVDTTTGRVVTNDYHLLSYEWETAFKPFHAPGAPDLYPEDLRDDIDALNQQLFDDVNNGPYKVLFASSPDAARVAKGVFEARLAELDWRVASRRYLFGDRLTDSDIRLFVTLLSFDQGYRPSFPQEVGPARRIRDYPDLWAYARDLFATPGFVSERELKATGILAHDDGRYTSGFGGQGDGLPVDHPLESWSEPAHREHLGGSPLFSGPGGAGSWVRHRAWAERRAGGLPGEDEA